MYDYKVVFEINGHHRYEQIVRATSDNKARELIYASPFYVLFIKDFYIW